MPLFSWLRSRASIRFSPSRAQHRSTTSHFRPQLEALEDRWLPSTLTVMTNLDSGSGSLRAEVAAASSGDTIVFASSLNGQTIKLTSGVLAVNKSLTIQGPGAGQLAVSGGYTSAVFEVYGTGTNVTLSGLTITQGNGGGTLNSGYGGGILNTNGSTLTINGCTLSNNRNSNGGGIGNVEATLKIVNSTLSGNTANDGNGGGEGGAVYSIGFGYTVSMTGCTLSNNTAGGGGAIWNTNTTMTISGCTLSGNSAEWDASAIHNNGLANMLTVNDSSLINNNNSLTNQFPISGPWTDGGGNTEVLVQANLADISKETLFIYGSVNNDSIVLAGNASSVTLTFDGRSLGNIVPAGSKPVVLVVVYGIGGDDTIDARALAISSVLVGGPGNDTLYGGSAPNLLIGWSGSDTLYAGSAGDILIGGTTTLDQRALALMMAEWDQPTVPYATRVGQLNGSLSDGLNGAYVLNSTTVFDDSASDVLDGGAGLDWFFAHLSGGHKDQVNGQTSGEVITSI